MKNIVRHLLIISSAGLVTAPSVTILAKPPAELNPLVVVAPSNQQNSLMSTQVVSADPHAKKLDRQARTQGISLSPYAATSPDLFSNATTVALNDNTNPTSLSSSVKEPSEGEAHSKSFGFAIQLGQTAGLYDRQDGTRERSLDMETTVSYKLPAKTKLFSTVTGSLDQNDSENNDWGSAAIGFTRGGYEYFSSSRVKLFSVSPSVLVSLPINKDQKDQSFQSGLKLGLTFGLEEGLLPSKRLSVSFGLTGSRNFFAYDQALNGRSNTQYSSSQSIALGWEFPNDFQLSLGLRHFNSWTFRGTPGESFAHSQELGYKISKSLSAAVGHQFGNPAASIYKADGSTSNFSLANENDSYMYANIGYTY